MSNRDELIAQFIEISGGEDSVARFYLSSSNWSLEEALANFLGTQGENGAGSELPSDNSSTSNVEGDTENAESFKKSYETPRFGTLKDMEQRSNNDDEEEGQAFYAGGSERSGQQVLGPPKQKNFREQLTDMFRMAHELNTSEDDSLPSTSGQSWGQGVRLGVTENDHSTVVSNPNANKTKDSAERKKPSVVLKLWQQGFSIDDGELRLYDNPENKEFLETVMRGEIPHELQEVGLMVNVDVEDHRQESYKKPALVQNFRGCGHLLGSPTPDVMEPIRPPIVPKDSATNTNNEKDAKDKLALKTAEPTTTLQIRLDDGTRLAAEFNLSHTVADIHQYIQNARPQYEHSTFILVSSFPTRELTNVAATVEEAGLKNASVFQRIKK